LVDNLLAFAAFSRRTYCRRVSAFNPVSLISAAAARTGRIAAALPSFAELEADEGVMSSLAQSNFVSSPPQQFTS